MADLILSLFNRFNESELDARYFSWQLGDMSKTIYDPDTLITVMRQYFTDNPAADEWRSGAVAICRLIRQYYPNRRFYYMKTRLPNDLKRLVRSGLAKCEFDYNEKIFVHIFYRAIVMK